MDSFGSDKVDDSGTTGAAVDADVAVAESGTNPAAGNGNDPISLDMENRSEETSPKYGEVMLAMKNMYSEGNASSSMESEDGSNEDVVDNTKNALADDDTADADADAVVPVSEDDVDSAMEKECQDIGGEPMMGMSSKEEVGAPHEEANDDSIIEAKEDEPTYLMTNNSSVSLVDTERDHGVGGAIPAAKTVFRKGYMGHVIIICQALVHACNANSAPEETNDLNVEDNNVEEEDDGFPPIEQSNSPLSSSSLDEICTTASFESSAVLSSHGAHQQNDDSSSCGKKRKDRSPIRDGTDDIKRLATPPASSDGDVFASPASPIPKVPSSPTHAAQAGDVAQWPYDDDGAMDSKEADNAEKESISMYHIFKNHPVHDKWQNFINSVLASEMSVQSTPLGGNQQQQQAHQNPASPVANSNDLASQIMQHLNMNDDTDLLGTVDQSGASSCVDAIGGMIVGEIVMDENDLDIAASMMEALSLPNNGGGNAQDGMSSQAGHGGHRRRNQRGVISSAGSENGSSSGGIGNFGSVIQQPGGFKDYIYDDPLGGVHPFGSNEDSSDEEEETKNSGSSKDDSEEDGFMSDAMVVSRDGDVSKQVSDGDNKQNGSIQKSGSTSSDDSGEDDYEDDDNDDDGDDDVPVMDLFAGSFEANFANFDAFDSATTDDSDPFSGEKTEENSSSSTGDDDFFAAISSNKSNGDEDAFEFSKTPFDLGDTLSNKTEDHISTGTGDAASASTFFQEETNDSKKAEEKGWS